MQEPTGYDDEKIKITKRYPKPKRPRYGLRKKKENFRGFWVFNFALYPKSKTQKSQKYLFFQILTVVKTPDLKITKIWTK